MIIFLLMTFVFAQKSATPPRTPNDDQFKKDIIQYTTDQYAIYKDAPLETARIEWRKKFTKNNCKRKTVVKVSEIKGLCDEINIHLNIIKAEQDKRIDAKKKLDEASKNNSPKK